MLFDGLNLGRSCSPGHYLHGARAPPHVRLGVAPWPPDPSMTEAARPVPSHSPSRDDGASSSEALQRLDRLVARYGPDKLLADTRSMDAAEDLAAVVRVLCCDARRANPGKVEPMIIALHTVWPRLPAVRRLVPSESATRLLAHIVALGIAEFYRDGLGDSSDMDGRRAIGVERAVPWVDPGATRS
jgi:hypothetical protein